ncbi:hypothetical protein LCGC14_2378490, partial [marine sediment metagenome]
NGNDNEVIKNINYFLKFKKKYKKDFPLVQMSFARNKFNYKELNNSCRDTFSFNRNIKDVM